MRLFLAALFVIGGMLAAVVLLSLLFPGGLPGLVVGAGMAVMFLLLCLAAMRIFNPAGTFRNTQDFIRELEEEDLLETASYRADRAFQAAEMEDEGSHYFLELEDGSVLYLTGQYLYEYEPLDQGAGTEHERRFPCAEFTIRRHRRDGYVIDILCRGEVLAPEVVAPPFQGEDFGKSAVPLDGEIIRGQTYDELKAWFTRPRRRW